MVCGTWKRSLLVATASAGAAVLAAIAAAGVGAQHARLEALAVALEAVRLLAVAALLVARRLVVGVVAVQRLRGRARQSGRARGTHARRHAP